MKFASLATLILGLHGLAPPGSWPGVIAQDSITNSGEASRDASAEADHEIWKGGIGSLRPQRLEWFTARLELPAAPARERRGRLRAGNERLYTLTIAAAEHGSDVQATLRRRGEDRIFRGRWTQDVLDLTADDEQIPDRILLRRIQAMSPQSLQQLAGLYEADKGHLVSFRFQDEGLAMTDYQTGEVRLLFAAGEDQFVAGPGLSIPDPVEFRFRFQRVDGKVTGVEIRVDDRPALVTQRLPDPQVEDLVYESFDGTRIAGSLFRPPGEGPFPAIVWVHGSGRATREQAGSWPYFLTHLGFAVLAVDKRGTGQSTGDYRLPDGGSDNLPHMRRRSRDVAAAVQTLAARPDIREDCIGLCGASQAGWVIPLAVSRCDVAFAVVLSGGATPLSIEDRYSRLAVEDASGSKLPDIEELIEDLRRYRPDDPGIDRELAAMDCPCLWLYGLKDRSNPSQICVETITRIGEVYKRNFTVRTFADGNHSLLSSRFGGAAESRTLKRLVPGLHATIRDWLATHACWPPADRPGDQP
jgi:pimeloyl-ACP methyl ester carboxylesterase